MYSYTYFFACVFIAVRRRKKLTILCELLDDTNLQGYNSKQNTGTQPEPEEVSGLSKQPSNSVSLVSFRIESQHPFFQFLLLWFIFIPWK